MSDEAAPISGSIEPRTFPLVLMSLHRNGVTGSLKVDGPTYQKALYFRSGRILFGSSNDPRDELGAILIVAGRLTAEQLADVKARVGPGNPLAKALQDSGFVSQREIGEAARGKVEQILADVLGYDAGSFEFEDGVLPKGAIDLKLSTPKLVLAAARRATDRAFVLRHLESLDAVLGPGAADGGEVRAEAGELLGLLDGTRSLKEAAAAAAIDEFEAAKIACGLLFLGVVENRCATPGLGAADAAPELDLSSDETPLFAAAEPQHDTTSQTMMLPSPFASVRPAELAEASAEPSLEATLDETFSRLNSADVQESFAAMREAEAAESERESAPEEGEALDIAAPAEPESPAPAAPRASKAELAAIDGLLKDKPASEGPLTPFERRSWEPEFPSKPVPSQPRRPQAGKRSSASPALALGLGGVALIAAGAVWYFFAGPGAAPSPAPVPPATVAAAQPSPTPAEPTTSPAEGATGDVVTTPAGATASEPLPAAAPPTTVIAAPATTPARPGTPPPTTAPAPVAAKAAPPTAQKPAPTAARPTTGGRPSGWPEASATMRRGDIDAAALAFARAARASGKTWTTQVLVACSKETVTKAAAAISSEDLFVVPVRYQKKDCFRVLWGLADAEAQAVATEIPGYFKTGGAAPKAVTLRSALP